MKAVDVTGGERMPWRVWLTRHGRKANRAFIKRQGCLSVWLTRHGCKTIQAHTDPRPTKK